MVQLQADSEVPQTPTKPSVIDILHLYTDRHLSLSLVFLCLQQHHAHSKSSSWPPLRRPIHEEEPNLGPVRKSLYHFNLAMLKYTKPILFEQMPARYRSFNYHIQDSNISHLGL